MISPDSTTQPNTPTTLALFSYDALEPDTRAYVQERTVEIRALMVRAAQDIVSIGGKLTDVKARLQHGQFGAWIEREFQMSAVSAWNFMRVYTRFGDKSSIIEDLNLGPTVLYLLAAPSVPDEAVELVLDRARAGEHVTVADVKQAINDARPAPEPDMFSGEPMLLEDYETGHPIWVNEDGEVVGVDPFTKPDIDAPVILTPSRPANWSSASNEWYTPAEYVNAAREVMGAIDLDPASNALANETVQADYFYTEADDGLAQEWRGRVFLNPPYGVTDGKSNAGVWARKLIAEYDAGHVNEAVLLVNANTERKWFAPLWNFPICFTSDRIKFYTPDGIGAQPIDGNALVYLGANVRGFADVFRQFGPVVVEVVPALEADNGY